MMKLVFVQQKNAGLKKANKRSKLFNHFTQRHKELIIIKIKSQCRRAVV